MGRLWLGGLLTLGNTHFRTSGGASRSGHLDGMGIRGISTALDSVSRRQERVEALNEMRKASEQVRHPRNHTRSIKGMTLEVLHDIQKPVVHVRVVRELDLHLVQVRQRVRHVERTVHRRRVVSRRQVHVVHVFNVVSRRRLGTRLRRVLLGLLGRLLLSRGRRSSRTRMHLVRGRSLVMSLRRSRSRGSRVGRSRRR